MFCLWKVNNCSLLIFSVCFSSKRQRWGKMKFGHQILISVGCWLRNRKVWLIFNRYRQPKKLGWHTWHSKNANRFDTERAVSSVRRTPNFYWIFRFLIKRRSHRCEWEKTANQSTPVCSLFGNETFWLKNNHYICFYSFL